MINGCNSYASVVVFTASLIHDRAATRQAHANRASTVIIISKYQVRIVANFLRLIEFAATLGIVEPADTSIEIRIPDSQICLMNPSSISLPIHHAR